MVGSKQKQKTTTYANISPKMANPRDGNAEEGKKKRK